MGVNFAISVSKLVPEPWFFHVVTDLPELKKYPDIPHSLSNPELTALEKWTCVVAWGHTSDLWLAPTINARLSGHIQNIQLVGTNL